MNDIKKVDNDGLMEFLHGGLASANIPKPFQRDIFLFETHVAGTTHIEGIMDLEPHLELGEKLKFVREPDNDYDKYAIKICTESNVKIGYVPIKDNIIFARLMDAGKLLFGKIDEKKILNNWLKIEISVYLHE